MRPGFPLPPWSSMGRPAPETIIWCFRRASARCFSVFWCSRISLAPSQSSCRLGRGGPEVTMTYPSSVHARALALPGRTGDAEPKKPNSAPPIRAAAKPVLGPCRRPGRQRNDDLRSDTWMARSNSKPQSDRLLGARVWRQGIQRLLYRGRPAASRAGVLAHDLTAWPARRSRR